MIVLRVFIAGIVTAAAAMVLGLMLAAMLVGCGGDGARCSRQLVDSEDGTAEVYLVCKAGDHTVVYEFDDQGKPIERPDGKVDYQYPDGGS